MSRHLNARLLMLATFLGWLASTGTAHAEIYRDWELICTDLPSTIAPGADGAGPTGGSEKVCYIATAVRNNEDNTVLAAVGVRHVGASATPTLMFQLLPSVDTGAGLRFAVDDGPVREGDVRGCDAEKCVVIGRLEDDLFAAMKDGRRMVLSFKIDDREVALEASLLGFTKAYQALEAAVL